MPPHLLPFFSVFHSIFISISSHSHLPQIFHPSSSKSSLPKSLSLFINNHGEMAMFVQGISIAVSPSSSSSSMMTSGGLAAMLKIPPSTTTTNNNHPLSSSAFLRRSFLSSSHSGFGPLLLPEHHPRQNKSLAVSASNDNAASTTMTLTGVLFQPFEEVTRDEFLVPISPNVSLARQRYSDDCEAAINEQINVEYNVSYVYHAMYAYFDRDNVALKGLAKFFRESSEEEREHAEKLMKYQNIRGGRVKLHPVLNPASEYEHVEKGDALYAMELALSLEKLVNEKLLNVHGVAGRNNDPQMADFIETEFLEEQVEAIKKIADYVTQLRMVGKGHGLWHFDQRLLHEDDGVH